MEVRVIKTDEEHKQALSRLEQLMDVDPIPGTEEADLLELLSLVISTYEEEHWPMELPDPVEAIRFRMDQESLKQVDIARILEVKPPRVCDVLNRKRGLTREMIRNLHAKLDIPLEVLIQDYPLSSEDTDVLTHTLGEASNSL